MRKNYSHASTLATGHLKPCPAEKLGVVLNTEGLPMAAKVMYHKEGRGKPLPVGVLVGATQEKVGGETVFVRFHVCSATFAAPQPQPVTTARGRRTACVSQQAKGQSIQERYAYHTFRRGDRVKYLGGGRRCLCCPVL